MLPEATREQRNGKKGSSGSRRQPRGAARRLDPVYSEKRVPKRQKASKSTRLGDRAQSGSQDEVALLALAEITGSFCHDLGNSLSALEFLLNESPRRRTAFRSALGIVNNAGQLLADLHQFARQFYQQEPQSISMLNINTVEPVLWNLVRDIVDLNRTKAIINVSLANKELRFPRILAYLLIVPLVKNAMQAMTRKVASSSRLTIALLPLDETGDLRLVVSDTGIGWQGRLENIRSQIDRGLPAASNAQGLLNVNRVARKLGGCLKLSDGPLGGACVEIRLPGHVCYGK